ncbi:DUF3850 domain-containing protein [Enterococcus rotai]|uniref:DUF3850 domain-containing protein n=1 Tax=Enterococcus rotai TaxID=118060 RepID=UPI0032B58AB0
MKWHIIKTLPVFFEASLEGIKPFEIRKNDRGYEVGDFVRLREFDGGKLTGREIVGEITYLTDYEQKEDYIVFGYERVALVNVMGMPDNLKKERLKNIATNILYQFFLCFRAYGFNTREEHETTVSFLKSYQICDLLHNLPKMINFEIFNEKEIKELIQLLITALEEFGSEKNVMNRAIIEFRRELKDMLNEINELI